MKNPFGSQQIPGSHHNLKERMFNTVKSAKVNEQILEIMMKAYEDALYKENIALTRPERKRLFSQILKLVFEEILKKYDTPPTGTEQK